MSGSLQNALTHYLGSNLPLDHAAYDRGEEITVSNASCLQAAPYWRQQHHHFLTQRQSSNFVDETCWVPAVLDKLVIQDTGSIPLGSGSLLLDDPVICRATVTDRSSGTIVISGDWGGSHMTPVTVCCWASTDNGGAARSVPRAVDGLTSREGYAGWAEISDKPAAIAFSIPPWQASVLERLSRLIELEDGWDGPDSTSIGVDVAVKAFEVLVAIATDKMPAPSISPSPSGDLQMAWYGRDLELEIDIYREGDPVIATYDRNSGEERELTPASPEVRAAIERLSAG